MSEALKTISYLPPNVAELALANLVLSRLSPAPQDDLELGETEKRLLAELSQSVADQDPKAKEAQLYDILNAAFDQLDDTISNPDEIKERAGTRGDLWPELYRVALSPPMEQHCRQMRVTPRLAVDAVQRPDAVDHLNPENFGFPEETFYSVSVKFFGASLKRYGLVALSERKGDELIIRNLWKFFVQDLDLSDARRPVDVLRTFAEKYGTEIRIGELISKFILYRVIPLFEFISVPTLDQLISIAGAKGRNLASMLVKIDPARKQINVGVAYNINMDKYATDLRKHGVRAKFEVLK
jgi:hypothetical protein